MDTDQMWKNIIIYDGPKLENSFIALSEKPGIGVEINEEGMRKYAVKNVPFFELYGFQLKDITITHYLKQIKNQSYKIKRN
jgi:hypothetical protein